MKIAIILNCGTQIKRTINADKIICCDGGYNFCPARPDLILGDLDSIRLPQNCDVPTIRHSPHKNASDGELAVYYAKENFNADEIVFYGVLGGRYDHTLCNFSIMKLANSLGIKAKAEEDGLDIYFVDGKFEIDAEKEETISILPFGGDALVTSSQNLEYPLENLLLTSSDSRGLSNVSLGEKVSIFVECGNVLFFRYFKE